MTIPQGESSDLRSVSDRQEVAFAEVVVEETATKTALLEQQEQEQKQQTQSHLESSIPQDLSPESKVLIESKDKLFQDEDPEKEVSRKARGNEHDKDTKIVSHKGVKCLDSVLEDKPDTECCSYDNSSTTDEATVSALTNPQLYAIGAHREDSALSALPLLKIPSCSSSQTPSVNYDHRSRKSSINIPRSLSQTSGSNANPRSKSRRKSLPQRLGLRYHKIPQDDVASPSDGESVDAGIFNLQYIQSPEKESIPSPQHPHQHHNLSFHNAEVHASFHTAKTTAAIAPKPHTTLQQPTNQSQTLPRDVTFKTQLPLDTTGGDSTSKEQKNPKNRKPGRGGKTNNIPLRRTLSLSLKSLNDLSAVHPSGRGNHSRKKAKFQGRSVSSEDLANCRIHRAGGGRFGGDPHPSPGSPSRCCLVSVARVPMAAATSHLTLDSEYQTVRLAVLGAPGVGKSSIVKQFVMQQFLEEYVPTEQRQVFCPAVIINDHLYEVRIIDCPYIPYFPVNSLYEWTDFRGYGLRNATAYVLVYDITSEESFEYIKSLRLQILESRNLHDVPIFVVGNKHDLAEERGVPRREVANLVKKQWKCGYIECSAKFNWHIMLLFKELMKTVDYIDYGHKPTSLRVQDALRRNRCLIL